MPAADIAPHNLQSPTSLPASVPDAPPDLHQVLHDVFGFGEFRALQEEAISAAVAGRDVLVVMLTGTGEFRRPTT